MKRSLFLLALFAVAGASFADVRTDGAVTTTELDPLAFPIATNAQSYASGVQTVATNAQLSANAASDIATNAQTYAFSVQTVATNAQLSANAAATIGTNAQLFANTAQTVATNAQTYASSVQTVATNAQLSATIAQTMATNAQQTATNGVTIATNAQTYATDTRTIATNAQSYATTTREQVTAVSNLLGSGGIGATTQNTFLARQTFGTNVVVTNQPVNTLTGCAPSKIVAGGPYTTGLVVQASDNDAAYDPKTVSGILAAYDGDNGIPVASGNNMSYWGDQSVNGFNATNSAANPPAYIANQVNGHGVVRFDAGENLTNVMTVTGGANSNFAVIAVVKMDSQTDNETLWSSGYTDTPGVWDVISIGSETAVGFGLGWNRASGAGGGTLYKWKAWSNAIYSIWACVETGAVRNMYINGVQILTNATTAFYATNTYYCGHIGFDDSGAQYRLDGDIAHLLVYESAITGAIRQQIEGYLADRYALQGYLPDDHPYKASGPGITKAAANIQEWHDNDGAVLASIGPTGVLHATSMNTEQGDIDTRLSGRVKSATGTFMIDTGAVNNASNTVTTTQSFHTAFYDVPRVMYHYTAGNGIWIPTNYPTVLSNQFTLIADTNFEWIAVGSGP